MSVPTGLFSHTQKVKKLYKRVLRNLESYYDRREHYRYMAVLMRDRFEQNRRVNDMRVAKDLLLKGEEELFLKQCWEVRQFAGSPGGSAYQREVIPPDWVVDYWHPLEKAQYPHYFARREIRKREYIKFWEKQFLNKERDGESCNDDDTKSGQSCDDDDDTKSGQSCEDETKGNENQEKSC